MPPTGLHSRPQSLTHLMIPRRSCRSMTSDYPSQGLHHTKFMKRDFSGIDLKRSASGNLSLPIRRITKEAHLPADRSERIHVRRGGGARVIGLEAGGAEELWSCPSYRPRCVSARTP